ncbi:hypothetical protein OAQ98_04280 [Alphaproteobacteria bacterium]|nr:hypothetical protein [Alphaproteobacteria bacterium]
MAFISITSILINWDVNVVIPTFAIFATPYIFISSTRFRNNVFSSLLLVFLFVYIYVPITFVSILGENYVFGWGLNSIPYDQEYYMNNYITNLYFLFICILSVFLSLSIFRTKFFYLKSQIKLEKLLPPLLILGIITFIVQANSILSILSAKALFEAKAENLILFLFYDHAYLLIAGVGLMTADIKNSSSFSFKTISIILITVSYMCVGMLAGSKASWLGIAYFFFLLSYSYIRNNPNSYILFPKIYIAILIIFFAPINYFVIHFYRISMTTSIEFNFFEVIAMFKFSYLGLLLEQILYRLSAGGFDRFMLISTSFLSSEISTYGIKEFLPYMSKNLINLLMPGTIYSEAYAQSSSLFAEVIKSKPLNGDVSSEWLLSQINSQAYTIFGVITIMTGWLAPIFIFVYNLILCFLYSITKHFLIRISLIYFYFTALSSFGFEVALGYAYHIIISLFFMYYFLLIFSMFKRVILCLKLS